MSTASHAPNGAAGDAGPATIGAQWMNWVSQGGMTRDFVGIAPAQLEAGYQAASQLYAQQRYSEACALFALLSMQDEWDARYRWGMAGCAQMLGHYDDAMASYGIVASLKMSDPSPHYRIAECLVALHMRTEALETLRFVLDLADGPEHAALHARASALKSLITQESAS